MTTKILNGPVAQFGRGTQTCTFTGGSLIQPSMKLGADGANWELLSEDEIKALAATDTKYRHISKGPIDHLCAGKAGWAFEVFASSNPHGVAFLHIRPPKKLDAAMGDGSNVNVFTGADLLRGYNYAKEGVRAPRLWRRNVPGWDEIAINFCIKAA